MPARPPIVLIAARDEADRLPATLEALLKALPGARIVVADDGSIDGTADVARAGGAEVVRSERSLGKGGAATLAAQAVLEATSAPDPPMVLLCDADLGASAVELTALLDAVELGFGDLAVGVFARRVGGGFGFAVNGARRAVEDLTGLVLDAPLSGQRAMRGEVLACVVPFAPRFGMEVGMTIDAVRAGFRVIEVAVELEHRATGRTLRGFRHRGRQLVDLGSAWRARR
ncbi:MAG: glycosyl transferase family 2 [Solirubrobacterales bacterium]|nr:glycosyl transferase family 2 [Solirubrobacterales bacterium]